MDSHTIEVSPEPQFQTLAQSSRAEYATLVARRGSAQWWTAVVLTASSERQADLYRSEIDRRLRSGRLPASVDYLVVPDLHDRRMGSGGATIHALGILTRSAGPELASWWSRNRVLMIHSGGDSRRLPQYSPSGKLFGALPEQTAWGDPSTVFDEMMALSTAWAARMPNGLLVASGDVVLTFDAAEVNWDLPGATGIAMRQPPEVGTQHGVYIAGANGRVYNFLQKPSPAEVAAAGGLLAGGQVALDSGLIRFDAPLAAKLSSLSAFDPLPPLDLYDHITKGLTGQWDPAPAATDFGRALAAALANVPFQCGIVAGDFKHIGTTRSFRTLASGAGVIDSVVDAGVSLGPDSVVLECNLRGPVRTGRGAILHGFEGIRGAVEVPENTVLHQVPVLLDDGRPASVIRVYGVEDNPKTTAGSGLVTWFGRSIFEVLAALELEPAAVWPGIPCNDWSLWNAELFPAGTVDQAWACARWMLGSPGEWNAREWALQRRLSLAQSALWADQNALAEARRGRAEAAWRHTALDLAERGSDVRPLLANPPSVSAVAEVGRVLLERAVRLASSEAGGQAQTGRLPITEAASQYICAAQFLRRSGIAEEAERADAAAFACIERAVREGVPSALNHGSGEWMCDSVLVAAPARIDLGGGWSDTPPFCLDWGGTVLNIALEIGGACPIQTEVRRLDEPLIRCLSEDTGETLEIRDRDELLAPAQPGSTFTIPRVALQMIGLAGSEPLASTLQRRGGGLEIRSRVCLPIGSGLGTSSILAATLLRALAEMSGASLPDQELSDQVMRLEQLMTTGGGWQDQAGGIFPGAKLLVTSPGLRQRIRVQPVEWTEARQREFSERMVLYCTGIQRIAKNLLKQVVRSYLAREVATLEVLHSIKTLATEMAHAMKDGEWEYLGRLVDRHWELNKILDPNTTNAPINAILSEVRPYIDGAKLAGAGGGGFLILLASSPEKARELEAKLGPGVSRFRVAREGVRVSAEPRRR